jgi:hypothetical protein
MGIKRKVAAAIAVAAIGVGAAAGTASAITITGGPAVSATWSNGATFTLAGAYTMTCDGGFAGTVSGTATMSVQPDFMNCVIGGMAATFDSPDDLELTITGTGSSTGMFVYSVGLPAGTSMTVGLPLAGCELTVSGPQTLAHGVGGAVFPARLMSSPSGVLLEATANGIDYTTNGMCPVSAGTDGTFSSDGPAIIEGIWITP